MWLSSDDTVEALLNLEQSISAPWAYAPASAALLSSATRNYLPAAVSLTLSIHVIVSTRCNIYISRLCYDVSDRLSVTEVHWRIIANLGFNFRSHFTAHCGHSTVVVLLAVLLAGGSSRAMLAGARSLVIMLFSITQPKSWCTFYFPI